MGKKLVKTDCILCVHSCGINIWVEDGRPVRVEGMVEHPQNKGVLCPRAAHLLEIVYSPERLMSPLEKLE